MPETRVDEFRRIDIPKRIRTRRGLERGSVLEINESEAVGDLDQALERHREERLRSVAWPVSEPRK